MNSTAKKFNEAVQHHQAGRLAEAEKLYREILAVDDRHAPALHLLAGIAFQAGQAESAVTLIKIAISIHGTDPLYHFNLGCALQQLWRFQEAADAHEAAIRLKPDYADAHNNRGCALRDLGLLEDAARSFVAAIRHKAGFAEAHNNLGTVLIALYRFEHAIAEFEEAIRLQPDFVQAHANLGQALQFSGRFEEAARHYGDAVRLKPDHGEAAAQRIHCLQRACAWKGLDQLQKDLLAGNSERYPPFIALTLDSTPQQQLDAARKWSEFYQTVDALPHRPRSEGEKIRIGYLSADFGNHPTGYLMVELIERHDRERFEIIGYSYGLDDGTPIRRRLEKAFDRFVDLRGVPEIPAVKRIHDDGIDILVDLNGYTTNARTELMVWRPAPVQVSFLGYPGTMGAGFIDYVIADSICIPEGDEAFFSEKVVRLEGCYQPHDSQREVAAETPSRAECGLGDEDLVFCCFNNSYKITPAIFAIWMRLLNKVPDSVLWLLDGGEEAKANLRREAEEAGIGADRLIFAPRQSPPQHMARHRLADLFLDTLPVNAHTTASDALWMGLPLLTCRGETFAGRVAASLLTAVGMEGMIASSLEAYEALALALATDPARLADLKAKLSAARSTAPLFDTDRYARSIEAAYEAIA